MSIDILSIPVKGALLIWFKPGNASYTHRPKSQTLGQNLKGENLTTRDMKPLFCVLKVWKNEESLVTDIAHL